MDIEPRNLQLFDEESLKRAQSDAELDDDWDLYERIETELRRRQRTYH